MITLSSALSFITFLALTCGIAFFLFPFLAGVFKFPRTFALFIRYFVATLFLAMSTFALLRASAISGTLAWVVTLIIFTCGTSLMVFHLRRETQRRV